MIAYHDHEWGVPCYDDQELFARLVLDGFQTGLSWAIILRARVAAGRLGQKSGRGFYDYT